MDTDNDRPTLARVYRSLRDICPDSWNLPGGRMPTGLGYDFLRPVEDSGINDLKHYYFMADLADGQPLGRANLYSVCFDLATTDRKLTPAWRTTIKRWFPGLKLGGVYGFYPRFTGPQRSTVKAAELGEIVLLGTNSYLGLATHPEVVEASAEATRRYGTGCSGSPLLNGTLDLHVSLEQELACFLGKPAAVLCSTGYQSNLAAISALCESGDMIIQDALNHRSLFDAARLSGADFTLYRHNDMDHLARVLRRTEGRRRIIVVDAVFSMEGTVADLATIAELADRHGCRVYVDESHALGVLGPDGRGASAALGVLARMDVVMGTFSKSFASVGGFIAGDRPVVDYIRHNGSGHVFSASLPPAAAAATHAALRVSRREPDRRARVLAAAEYMATGLARQGYQAEYHGTAIVPVILGNPTVAHAGYLRLMRSGVYVNPVAPPAVPEERSGFRTSYLADHRQSDLDRALHVFAGLAEDLTPQGAAL